MRNEQQKLVDGLRVEIDGQDLLLILMAQTPQGNYDTETLIKQLISLSNKGIVVFVHVRPDGTIQVSNKLGNGPQWKQKIEAMNLKVSDFKKIPFSPS